MRNIHLISSFICISNILQFTEANHLKVRHVCENQHIDITKASGVSIEENSNSLVTVSGVKFPLNSFADGDKLTIQFRTSSRNGLIFHAQSRHLKHELTAYIEEGQIRLRLSGHCHWLYVRDIAHDSYNVSDNNFHTLIILTKSSGISFTIDHRDERTFLYAVNPVFRCWHIQNYYFGQPSPTRLPNASPQPELSQRIDGCLRYFTSERTNNTDTLITTSYKRVSSCEGLS